MGFKVNSTNNQDISTDDNFLSRFTKKFGKKRSVLDLLPYKSMNANNQLNNMIDGVEDYYLIRGKALKNTSRQQGWALIDDFQTFTQTYVDDVKIFISMYPTETFEQQKYFTFKINEASKNVSECLELSSNFRSNGDIEKANLYNKKAMQYRTQIDYIRNTFLKNEIIAAKELKNQEYLMVVYGDNADDVKNKVRSIKRWGGDALDISKIDPDKKIKKIASFLNPTRLLNKY